MLAIVVKTREEDGDQRQRERLAAAAAADQPGLGEGRARWRRRPVHADRSRAARLSHRQGEQRSEEGEPGAPMCCDGEPGAEQVGISGRVENSDRRDAYSCSTLRLSHCSRLGGRAGAGVCARWRTFCARWRGAAGVDICLGFSGHLSTNVTGGFSATWWMIFIHVVRLRNNLTLNISFQGGVACCFCNAFCCTCNIPTAGGTFCAGFSGTLCATSSGCGDNLPPAGGSGCTTTSRPS